jgi:hypothetical protein
MTLEEGYCNTNAIRQVNILNFTHNLFHELDHERGNRSPSEQSFKQLKMSITIGEPPATEAQRRTCR